MSSLSGGSCLLPWLEHDLSAPVRLIPKHAVRLRRVVQRQRMADHGRRIDLSILNALQQWLHIAHHVGLPGLHGQSFVHECAHRHLVDEAGVHSGHRNRSTLLAGHDRLPEHDGTIHFKRAICLTRSMAKRVVCPAASSPPRPCRNPDLDCRSSGESIHHVDLVEVEGFRTAGACHLQPLGDAVDGDYPAGTEHEALLMANCPTGPQPHTATVSPG